MQSMKRGVNADDDEEDNTDDADEEGGVRGDMGSHFSFIIIFVSSMKEYIYSHVIHIV